MVFGSYTLIYLWSNAYGKISREKPHGMNHHGFREYDQICWGSREDIPSAGSQTWPGEPRTTWRLLGKSSI